MQPMQPSIFIPGPTSVIHPGDLVDGRYKVISLIANGGMGTVFLAEHVMIKRRVALKVLHPDLAGDIEMVQRFLNEASAAGSLGHPNIVESTDMGFTPERVPFIVFEYLEGALLTEEIYRVRGMSPRRALRIARQIASALDAAHGAGIIHQDLKSDNVFLVDRDGATDHVKVLDFGIAKFMEADADNTQRNLVMGTPEFMSPEQITMPDQVDARSDVWALGVVLYEMLTARRPYNMTEGPRLLLHRIVHETPPPMARRGVPEELERAVMEKMLAKDPAERFASMHECIQTLEAILHDLEQAGDSLPPPAQVVAIAPAPPPAPVAAERPRLASEGYRRPPAPARRWPLGVLALALLAGAGGGGLLYAEQRMVASIDDAALRELESDAAQLTALLEARARSAKQRAEMVASAPVLRTAIDTDAATIDDVIRAERLLVPAAGETLELFHGDELVQRAPAGARAIGRRTEDKAGLALQGDVLHVIAAAPINSARDEAAGAVAVRIPVDLAPLRARLSTEVLGATLTGLEAPVSLVASTTTTTDAVEYVIPVAVPAGLDAVPLALRAQLRVTPRGQTLRKARYGAWGAGAVLMFGFVAIGAARGRRSRRAAR